VDELAARTGAGGVAVLAALAPATGGHWLVVLLAVGFAARTAVGPRFSLLRRLANQAVAPGSGCRGWCPGRSSASRRASAWS
jgi:uncharacterized protein DUF4395